MSNYLDPATLVTVTIPTSFWFDHVDRDCFLEGELYTLLGVDERDPIVKRSASKITLALQPYDVASLWSDADYYAGLTGSDYTENRSLVTSARATIKALAGLRDSFGSLLPWIGLVTRFELDCLSPLRRIAASAGND